MDLNDFVEIISYVCGGVVTIKFTVMFLTFSLSMRNLGIKEIYRSVFSLTFYSCLF